MKTRFLLPHRFKIAGIILFITGFIGWLWGQADGSARLIKQHIPAKGKLVTYHPLAENQQIINAAFLTITFFGFIIGILLTIISKEKVEDEYTQKLRLETYQFAAFAQFLLIFSLIIIRFITGSQLMERLIVEAGLLFIVLFWAIFIIRFNLLLFISKKKLSKETNEK
ncbi:MAG: hypothetical protein QM725_10790 [Lacibacter sp.]